MTDKNSGFADLRKKRIGLLSKLSALHLLFFILSHYAVDVYFDEKRALDLTLKDSSDLSSVLYASNSESLKLAEYLVKNSSSGYISVVINDRKNQLVEQKLSDIVTKSVELSRSQRSRLRILIEDGSPGNNNDDDNNYYILYLAGHGLSEEYKSKPENSYYLSLLRLEIDKQENRISSVDYANGKKNLLYKFRSAYLTSSENDLDIRSQGYKSKLRAGAPHPDDLSKILKRADRILAALSKWQPPETAVSSFLSKWLPLAVALGGVIISFLTYLGFMLFNALNYRLAAKKARREEEEARRQNEAVKNAIIKPSFEDVRKYG